MQAGQRCTRRRCRRRCSCTTAAACWAARTAATATAATALRRRPAPAAVPPRPPPRPGSSTARPPPRPGRSSPPHLAVGAQLLELLIVLLGGHQRVAAPRARGHGAVQVLFVRGRQRGALRSQQVLQLVEALVQVLVVLAQRRGLHVKVGRHQRIVQLFLCSGGAMAAAPRGAGGLPGALGRRPPLGRAWASRRAHRLSIPCGRLGGRGGARQRPGQQQLGCGWGHGGRLHVPPSPSSDSPASVSALEGMLGRRAELILAPAAAVCCLALALRRPARVQGRVQRSDRQSGAWLGPGGAGGRGGWGWLRRLPTRRMQRARRSANGLLGDWEGGAARGSLSLPQEQALLREMRRLRPGWPSFSHMHMHSPHNPARSPSHIDAPSRQHHGSPKAAEQLSAGRDSGTVRASHGAPRPQAAMPGRLGGRPCGAGPLWRTSPPTPQVWGPAPPGAGRWSAWDAAPRDRPRRGPGRGPANQF